MPQRLRRRRITSRLAAPPAETVPPGKLRARPDARAATAVAADEGEDA